MATAKKLPSGAWRTRATKIIGNKKITKSFTVHPNETKGDSRKAKYQSELLAREWQTSTESDEVYGITISKALTDYVEDRKRVLSPRTIYDYNRLIPFFDSIKDICVSDIKTADIQALINEWSISVKAKTIQNRISFLLSALDYAECDKRFRLRYPQKQPRKILAPDVGDVQILMRNAPEDLRPVIALAAFGGLRRGEIAALSQRDISRDMNTVSVHADVVKTDEGWKYKPFPKTSDSTRVVQLPRFVMDLLPRSEDEEASLFPFNPNMIGHRYDNLRRKCGLEYTFHSLRHFAASFRSDLGIPSKYIEEVGGWKNSTVLKDVYDNRLNSSRKKYTQIANKFLEDNFEDILREAK